MRKGTLTLVRIAMVASMLALIPLLAACAQTTPPTTTDAATPAGSAASDATVRLVEPTAGATVAAGTVTVRVETTGLKFSMPSNTNVSGEGHVHFTLDDRPFIMSVEPQAELEDVSPGQHTLKAELVQNDTQSFDPPIVETIEFVAE